MFRTFELEAPERLTEIPGVLATGFGIREKDSEGEVFPIPVVKVFVGAKRALEEVPRDERIPLSMFVWMRGLGGSVGRIELLTDVVALSDPPATAFEDEVGFPGQACGGHKVFVSGVPSGTLGCIARRRSTGERVLVTCFHVVSTSSVPAGAIPAGQVVRMDLVKPSGPAELNQEVGRVVTGAKVETPGHLDVAVAVITRLPSAAGPVRRLRGLPRHPVGFVPAGEPLVGKRLRKVGVATRITCGIVTAHVDNGTLPSGQPIRDTLIIRNTEAGQCTHCTSPHAPSPISRGADSGAVWITDEPIPRAAALHWGGDENTMAFATPWSTIEATSALDVTITL